MTIARHLRSARFAFVLLTFGVFAPALPLTAAAATSSAAEARATTRAGASKSKASASKKVKRGRYSARAANARRTKLARARAAARARELAEAQQPRYKLNASGVEVPDVRAASAIIYNPENGQVLYESNSTAQRSIASITKVMTATVFFEQDPDLSQEVVIQRVDVRNASTTFLRAGYRIKVDDLLHLLLIASDNGAARTLARVSSYGSEGFISRMNQKAQELGLENTHYADPSGLDPANVSSAYDMARLITYVSGDERIAGLMRTPRYSFVVNGRTIQVHSTNQLVMKGDVDVRAGKTGFIGKAGYCLATLLRLPQGGPQVAVVVLGARSNAGRFMETRHLFNWLSAKAQDLFSAKEPPPENQN